MKKNNYWVDRQAKELARITNIGIRATEKKIKEYYRECMESVIDDFISTYEKILATVEAGNEPTPADLYKLDKYWKMQSELNIKLQRLGDKTVKKLSKSFETEYEMVYKTIALKGDDGSFSTYSKEVAKHTVSGIWCADGKSWSDRVWGNTSRLQQKLNENLISCLVTGKSTRQLRDMLTDSFGVSYRQANTLINTEMARIQVQAAKDRYTDYGLRYYEILGNEDDSCGSHKGVDCYKMHGKRFLLAEMQVGVNAPPFHPNCRCDIIPVVEE